LRPPLMSNVRRLERHIMPSPRLVVQFFVVLGLSQFCVSAALAADRSPVPRKLEAYRGTTFGQSHSVKLQDGVVTCQTTGSSDRRVVGVQSGRPTYEQWSSFHEALDHQNVWNWKSNRNFEIRDGSGWSLLVEYEDRSVNVAGINSYPTTDGNPGGASPTLTFLALASAVSSLVPGCVF
jgi:hypothetical protein